MSLLPALPFKAPACFPTQQQWDLVRNKAAYLRSCRKLSHKYTYCTDCTPEYRDQMQAEGRCKFPGTTFSKTNSIIVGSRAR